MLNFFKKLFGGSTPVETTPVVVTDAPVGKPAFNPEYAEALTQPTEAPKKPAAIKAPKKATAKTPAKTTGKKTPAKKPAKKSK